MTEEREPLRRLENATIYYLDDHDAENSVRSEGVTVEIYDHWARIRTPADTWVPRELVEKVML